MAAEHMHSAESLVFDDVMDWNTGPSSESAHIYIEIYPSTLVERGTPSRCCRTFCLHHRRSSSSSGASSSTLSSTDLPVSDRIQIMTGDLLVLKCRMSCRDYLQPPGLLRASSSLARIHVFSIRATHAEVIV
ncbi:hypothetical protein DFH06DRAFT_1131882 [Mycena polygramma]|nr:hypothetical protein DFH06DRAFT_1140101 [Mycena polygramma]KAJ7657394.1 hypothetical protein DFH06DRAFT_1131882 [Mycena polygramma]